MKVNNVSQTHFNGAIRFKTPEVPEGIIDGLNKIVRNVPGYAYDANHRMGFYFPQEANVAKVEKEAVDYLKSQGAVYEYGPNMTKTEFFGEMEILTPLRRPNSMEQDCG